MVNTKIMVVMLLVLLLVAMPFLGACSKEVVKEVPVEKIVEKEVIKEVPVEKVVEKEVIKEVPVEKVVEKEVIKEVPEVKKEIYIGYISDMSGPASRSSNYVIQAIKDYVRYFNEELGGIPGAEIKVKWADTAYKLPEALSAYRRLKDQITVGFGTITQDSEAFKPLLADDQLPWFSMVNTEALEENPGWMYFPQANYADQFGVFAEWFMENWKESRPPTMAIMGADHPWAKSVLPNGVAYAEKLGINVLPYEVVPYIPVDVTPNLLRLKNADVDIVYVTGLDAAMAPVLKNARDMGLLDKFQFAGYESVLTVDLISMVGDLSEGVMASQMYPSWTDDVEGINLIKEVQQDYHITDVTKNYAYINGFVGATLATEAIKRAAAEVGVDKVDGAAVKKALDNFKDFDVYGLSTISFTPNNHSGKRVMQINTVKDGAIVHLSDWLQVPSVRQ